MLSEGGWILIIANLFRFFYLKIIFAKFHWSCTYNPNEAYFNSICLWMFVILMRQIVILLNNLLFIMNLISLIFSLTYSSFRVSLTKKHWIMYSVLTAPVDKLWNRWNNWSVTTFTTILEHEHSIWNGVKWAVAHGEM